MIPEKEVLQRIPGLAEHISSHHTERQPKPTQTPSEIAENRALEIMKILKDTQSVFGKNVSYRGDHWNGGLVVSSQPEIPGHIIPNNGEIVDIEELRVASMLSDGLLII